CGCGEDATYNPAAAPMGQIPCLSKQLPSSCGGGQLLTPGEGGAPDCITAVAAYVPACGSATPTYPPTSIANAPAGSVACGQPEGGLVLPAPPHCACGCGVATNGDRCIPNVAQDVCGASAPTEDDLAEQPQFLCGCGEDVLSQGRPCLSNVALTVCGTLAVPPGAIDWLPGRLCGCGAELTYNP